MMTIRRKLMCRYTSSRTRALEAKVRLLLRKRMSFRRSRFELNRLALLGRTSVEVELGEGVAFRSRGRSWIFLDRFLIQVLV
jgi:hypothetical protein